MKIDTKSLLLTVSGVPYAYPPEKEGAPPIPLLLGSLLIDAALLVPMRETQSGSVPAPQTAMQIVYRDSLARRLYAALSADDGVVVLSTRDVEHLVSRLPLLESQRGVAASAIASALIAIAPDDFGGSDAAI